MNVTTRRRVFPVVRRPVVSATVPWYLLKGHNIELCLIRYKGDHDRVYGSHACWKGQDWSTHLDHTWLPCESLALGFVDACASNVTKLTVIVSSRGVVLAKSHSWVLPDAEMDGKPKYIKTTAAKAITMITNLQALMEVHLG
jgi:hypothetical protein